MDDYFGVKTKTLNSERLDNDERRALTVMKFPRSNYSVSKEMNEVKNLN